MNNKTNIEEKQCCKCGSDYESVFYKYDGKIYCFDCLTEELENKDILHIDTTTYYYNDDWGELGTSENIDEAIQNICEEYEVEEVDG